MYATSIELLVLLISFVLAACGQPDSLLSTSPTVTMADQANPTSTPINGGQSSDLAIIEQLQRPAQSQPYEFAPNPMSANINDWLRILMPKVMLDQLMTLDPIQTVIPTIYQLKQLTIISLIRQSIS